MTHDEINAALSAFALGVLDPEEHQAVAEHLAAGCPECERELTSWRDVVGLLALDSREATPPDLKPALMQQVRSVPRRGRVIRLPRWTLVPLAAAAMAILALSLVREVRIRSDLAQQQQRIASLTSELATAQDAMQRLTTQLAQKENDLTSLRATLAAAQESLAILQAPGLQLVQLKETETAPPAEGHVLLSTQTRQAIFYAFALPEIPADKAYELWWITEKEGPVNAGVFRPNPKGLGRIETSVPTEAGAIQAAAVTIEPAGGMPKPTGPMVLIGKL
jgi:anti-sigma-K factor RskA